MQYQYEYVLTDVQDAHVSCKMYLTSSKLKSKYKLVSAISRSLLQLVILIVTSVFQHSLVLKSLPRPAFLGVGPVGFWLHLARFPLSEVCVADLCPCCLSSVIRDPPVHFILRRVES